MSRGFFFFICHFSETAEIYLGSNKLEICTGKKSILHREKIEKRDFAPPEKYSSYASVQVSAIPA